MPPVALASAAAYCQPETAALPICSSVPPLGGTSAIFSGSLVPPLLAAPSPDDDDPHPAATQAAASVARHSLPLMVLSPLRMNGSVAQRRVERRHAAGVGIEALGQMPRPVGLDSRVRAGDDRP